MMREHTIMHEKLANGMMKLAEKTAIKGANRACIWLSHQEKEPQSLQKFAKHK